MLFLEQVHSEPLALRFLMDDLVPVGTMLVTPSVEHALVSFSITNYCQ